MLDRLLFHVSKLKPILDGPEHNSLLFHNQSDFVDFSFVVMWKIVRRFIDKIIMRKENIAAMRYGMPTQTTTGPNAYRVIRGTSQISVRNHPGNNLDDRHQNNRNEPLRFDSLYNQKFGAGRLWQPEPKASGLQLYSKDRLTADRLQNKEEKPNSQTLSRLERVNKQISTPAI